MYRARQAIMLKKLGFKLKDKLLRIYHNSPFLYWHYAYILSWIIIGSVLIYPVKNMAYIDALFFATGTATQAGLNTLNVNSLVLYQQVVLYIIPFCTNIVIVHTGVVFFRLHWFEKHIKGIRETSKLQSKMRRTATTIARGETMGSSPRDRRFSFRSTANPGRATSSATHPGSNANNNDNTSVNNNAPKNETIQLTTSNFPNAFISPNYNGAPNNDIMLRKDNSAITVSSDPNSKCDNIYTQEEKISGTSSSSSESATNEEEDKNLFVKPPVERDIKFGDLPSPREKEFVAPRDMYMSINMMRRSRRPSNDAINDGPALIIKGPREQDEENELLEHVAKYEGGVNGHGLHSITNNSDTPTSRLRRFSLSLKKSKLPKISTSSDEEDTEDEFPDGGSIQRARTHADGPISSISVSDNEPKKITKRSYTLDVPPVSGTGTKSASSKTFRRTTTFDRILSNALGKRQDTMSSINMNNLRTHMSSNYLSWEPTVARNSDFVDLTDEQKEELGGVEYRALKTLAKILLSYFIGIQIISIIGLVPWSIHKPFYANLFYSDGFTPGWWAAYIANSAFFDVGYALTPDSLMSLQQAPYVLLLLSFLIIAGNTGFPVFLRFYIWILYKIATFGSQLHESLGFLLDHPRRCFTLLFPASVNWWLFFVLVALNSLDLVLFIVLNLNNPVITDIPTGYRIVCGLFQAVSTRTAGFSCINLAALHPAIQISYLVMMYISVLPIAISVRHTNVYEERSLGIFYATDKNGEEKSSSSLVGAHLRRQLSFDLWYIMVGVFIICICEGDNIANPSDTLAGFTVFNVIFEVVSAYGTVGMSLGYAGVDASFSSQFTTVSKLVMIAMMIRGRHRGLPYSLDRAIILPSDKLNENDQMQQQRQVLKRTLTNASVLSSNNDTYDARASLLNRNTSNDNLNNYNNNINFNSRFNSNHASHLNHENQQNPDDSIPPSPGHTSAHPPADSNQTSNHIHFSALPHPRGEHDNGNGNGRGNGHGNGHGFHDNTVKNDYGIELSKYPSF